VGIDIPLRFGVGENADVAFLLPPSDTFNDKINLIVPPYEFDEGEFVVLSQKGTHEKAKLEILLEKGNAHRLYQCSLLINPVSLEVKRG
jgi:hypothetical protein